jgi:predicted SprT family Zn-dependent metalloprotease
MRSSIHGSLLRPNFSLADETAQFRAAGTPEKACAMVIEPDWTALIAPWCETWGVPDLPARLRVTTSARFRSSLGRCNPVTGEVRIASFLLAGSSEILHETVCHEVAHAAVFELHGRRVRPHGKEWKALMRAAGFEPRARVSARELNSLAPTVGSRRARWEHRCPVCHMRRTAGRPMREWRCAGCYDRKLDGRLNIVKVLASDP